jgi:hypothetical protein
MEGAYSPGTLVPMYHTTGTHFSTSVDSSSGRAYLFYAVSGVCITACGRNVSLTLEAVTYDWALRLPYEILKPMITPLLVNFEFYLHLVKVLMKIIAADLSSGMKVY